MSRSKILLSALAIAVSGALVAMRPIVTADALGRLKVTDLATHTYNLNGEIHDIRVTDYAEDVKIVYAADGNGRVVVREDADINHTVDVRGGVLTISRPEKSGAYYGKDKEPSVTIYLPGAEYGSLSVTTTSGDVEVSRQLTFASVTLNSTSGDHEISANVNGNVSCTTTSGDIELSGRIGGLAALSTSSGDVELNNLQASGLDIKTTSGDVDLERVNVAGEARIETTSGDIELEHSDAASLMLSTTSGKIEGSLASGKNFNVSSSSGRIRVPASDPAGGSCMIKTVSGNVELKIQP